MTIAGGAGDDPIDFESGGDVALPPLEFTRPASIDLPDFGDVDRAGGGEGPAAFGFAEDPFGPGEAARTPSNPDEDGVEPGPGAASAAASAARAFDARADNGGVRYETLEGAVYDTARRANWIGERHNVEAAGAIYRDGDGRYVPTRIGLGEPLGVDALRSLTEADRKGTAHAAVHTHNAYVDADTRPTYDPSGDVSVDPNRFSEQDLRLLRQVVKINAYDVEAPETFVSGLVTPDGTVLFAEGTFDAKLHDVKLDMRTYEYPGADAPGALVHSPGDALEAAAGGAAGAAIGGAGAVAEDFAARQIDDALGLPFQGSVAGAAARFTERSVPLSTNGAAGGGVLVPSHHAAHAFSSGARRLFIDSAGAGLVGGAVSGLVSAGRNLDGIRAGDAETFGEVAADAATGTLSGTLGSAAGVAASALAGAQRGSAGGWPGAAAGLAVGLGTGLAVEYGFEGSGAKRAIADATTEAIDANEAVLGETARTVRDGGDEVVETVVRTGKRAGQVARDTAGHAVEGVHRGTVQVWDELQDAAAAVAETGRDAFDGARRAIGDAKETIGDAWEAVGGWFGGR